MTTSNIKAIVPCDIHKVWETVLAVENYPVWRSDVSTTQVTDEKQFIEYTADGYSTVCTVTAAEMYKRWELDIENTHTKGHWTMLFSSKGNDTEIDFTVCLEAKQLSVRPIGKSVFEQTYMKKEQTQFIMDLKKALV